MPVKLSDLPVKKKSSGGVVSLDSLPKKKKNFLGDRPGIDDPRLRKNVGHVITGLEIGAPLLAGAFSGGTAVVPTSVISSGVGEYARALTEGKSQQEALGAGAFGAATDFALGKVGGMIGKGAGKIVKGKLGATIGEEAVEKVMKNIPKYTSKSDDTYRTVTKLGRESLEGLVNKSGKEVGKAKAIARQTNKVVDTTGVKKEITEMFSKKGLEYMDDLSDFASPTQLRKTIKRIDNLPDKVTLEELMKAVDRSYDNLNPIYNKSIAGNSLTDAEILAKRAVGKLNELSSKSASEVLPAAKKKYIAVMDILNSENREIGRAIKTQKGFNSLLNSTIKNKRWTTFENLLKLDDMLPKGEKFMDKHLQRLSGESLRNLKSLYLSEAGLRTTGFTMVPRLAAKGLRGAAHPMGISAMQVIKTGTRRTPSVIKNLIKGDE